MNRNIHTDKYPYDLDSQLNRAVQFHQSGHLQKAMEVYEKLIEISPEHPDTLHLLGFAYHQLGKNEMAVKLISTAIRICPECPAYHNSLGLILREQGKLNDAISCYRKAMELDPKLIASYNNTGVALQEQGNLEEAISYYQEALKINPDIAEIHNNIGNIYQSQKKLDQAATCYQKALEIHPEYFEAYYNMGNVYQSQGEHDEAAACYQKAVNINPEYPEAYHELGNAYQNLSKVDEALACYERVLVLDPLFPETYINMGIAHQKNQNFDTALGFFKKAIENESDSPEPYYYLGTAYQNQGRFHEATACFRKTLELNPNHPDACHNMGILLQSQGSLEEALAYYEKAIELRPEHAETYHNVGTVFQNLGNMDEATASFQRALALNPFLAQTHVSLGNTFKDNGKLNESFSCYKKALKIDPDNAKAYSHLVHLARETCSWQELEDLTAKLDYFTKKALDEGTKTAEMPFLSLMREAHPSLYLGIAQSWSRDIYRQMSTLKTNFSFENRKSSVRRITVGYLSNTFRNHPGSHLILGLFRLHNRDNFKIVCYSYGEDDGSYYRKRIKQDCDKFFDFQDLGHAAAARQIYDDRVDILVDLRGHTKGNRFITALRPAPVQVSYLGFPGTTGADFYDYLITDRIVTPEEHTPYYSEKLVYMPHCYQINDHKQTISNKKWKREDFGLPDKGFVFCSFNNAYKIEPVMFDTWMKILHRVPGSILWLLRVNKIAERNLRQEASSRGINPERIIFSDGLPKDEHLARFKLADLAIDTRIYNGHTTTSDALWAGVPVITLKGKYFPSRVSSSILTAIGMPDLITASLEEYETLAIRLANNPNELQIIKQRLAKNRLTEPLFDTPRFTRNLEKAYREMWKIMSAGERPQQIGIIDR